MCIIVLKLSGVSFPDSGTLLNCFINNPDGAGIMYRDPSSGQVAIVKGLMTWRSLKKALRRIKSEIDIDGSDIAIHFRIGTSGSKSPHATHPFPINPDVKELRALQNLTDGAIMHNGILHEYAKKGSLSSDTMFFTKEISMEKNIQKLVRNVRKCAKQTGSKFVIMDKNDTFAIGSFQTVKGVYYSNYSYLDPEDYADLLWDSSYYSRRYYPTKPTKPENACTISESSTTSDTLNETTRDTTGDNTPGATVYEYIPDGPDYYAIWRVIYDRAGKELSRTFRGRCTRGYQPALNDAGIIEGV